MDNNKSIFRALRNFGLVAAASIAAASIWASGLPEEGYLMDAEMWRQEVATAKNRDWPADGWYRLQPQGEAIAVTAVRRGDTQLASADALYFRMPGTALQQGSRPTYRYPAVLEQPKLGQDYELSFGRSRFSLRVESGAKGMQYAIGYGGQIFHYTLGPFDATHTAIKAVADLDGDRQPDFLIGVGDDATYLLLSTRARPGQNLPTAELWVAGC